MDSLSKRITGEIEEPEVDEAKGTKMICNECGAKFTKKIGKGTVYVECPKCGGVDTEVNEEGSDEDLPPDIYDEVETALASPTPAASPA